jgi:flagellar hook-basal body complex protein FliE
MINRISKQGLDLGQLEQTLRSQQDTLGRQSVSSPSANETNSSFANILKDSIGQVDSAMKSADQSAQDLATGKNSNIHETMLSATKAELGFNLLVQLRNKAIESYQEVMRMQV